METIITTTGLSKEEVDKCEAALGEYAAQVDSPISKKDNPKAGVYVYINENDSAKLYTVREVDVKGEIAKLSDSERASYCDAGYRIKGLHSPAHIKVKADLGLVKASSASRAKEETLREVIQKLVDSGMGREEAESLILPKG